MQNIFDEQNMNDGGQSQNQVHEQDTNSIENQQNDQIESESENDSDDYEQRIQRIKESLEDDETFLQRKQFFSYLILFMTCGQSIVVPLIQIYETFTKYQNQNKNAFRRKKKVKKNIYDKYKDWKPRQPSYFDLMKQKEHNFSFQDIPKILTNNNSQFSNSQTQDKLLNETFYICLIASIFAFIYLYKRFINYLLEDAPNVPIIQQPFQHMDQSLKQLISQSTEQLSYDFEQYLFNVTIRDKQVKISDDLNFSIDPNIFLQNECIICQESLLCHKNQKDDLIILLGHNLKHIETKQSLNEDFQLTHKFHAKCLKIWFDHQLKDQIIRNHRMQAFGGANLIFQNNLVQNYADQQNLNHIIQRAQMNYDQADFDRFIFKCPTCRAQIDFRQELKLRKKVIRIFIQ